MMPLASLYPYLAVKYRTGRTRQTTTSLAHPLELAYLVNDIFFPVDSFLSPDSAVAYPFQLGNVSEYVGFGYLWSGIRGTGS